MHNVGVPRFTYRNIYQQYMFHIHINLLWFKFYISQVFLKVTQAAEKGEDIIPEVMSVVTASSFNLTDRMNSELPYGYSEQKPITPKPFDTQSTQENLFFQHQDNSEFKLYNDKSYSKKLDLKWNHSWFRKLNALIHKRFHHNRRDYRSITSQIILPSLFVCIAMACILVRPVSKEQPSLHLNLSVYEPWSSEFFRYMWIKIYVFSCFSIKGTTGCLVNTVLTCSKNMNILLGLNY